MTENSDKSGFGITDGEACPKCDTDISVVGNGCSIEVVEDSRLAEVKRKCYNCHHEWSVESFEENGSQQESDVPTKSIDLDATTLLSLGDFDVGDELWVPVSPIREDKFRAMKISVEKRVSVNNYEVLTAIDKWPLCDRIPTSHELSEGINQEDSQSNHD